MHLMRVGQTNKNLFIAIADKKKIRDKLHNPMNNEFIDLHSDENRNLLPYCDIFWIANICKIVFVSQHSERKIYNFYETGCCATKNRPSVSGPLIYFGHWWL